MSITDGTYVCGRCGEWMTSCSVCQGESEFLVPGPEHPNEVKKRREDENEMYSQERAIRMAADRRQGWH